MASPQIKERPSGVVLNTISKGASPESKCPICLDHFKNISYLDVCLHKFCFCCIHEWSKNKAECPLCKQPFNSFYHTIKSEDDYKRFDLRPTENGSFGNMAGQRFRYRTTLTGNRRLAQRRTSPPPDHGIIFEGLRGSLPQRHNRDLHSMIRRLTVRQRRESEGRSVRSLQDQEVVKFRRALYRRGVRVQSVQDGGRTRETSAEFFKRNPACLHRLVPWLRRELTVLYGAHGSLVNIVQHIIMTLITRQNLDDQAVQHELRPFLLSHTEHFLHEFLSFARSPFNMEAYDQRAIYDLPRPSGESSSSENSVIAISEDESESLVSGAQDFATPRVTLSQTAWDDETPGPSYSSEPSQVLPVHVRDSDSDSSVGEAVMPVAAVPHQDRSANPDTIPPEEDHSSSNEEDCVIIGYVKPVAERTPELVQLSSDSENSETEQNAGPQDSQAPQHIRFISDSDASPMSQRPLGGATSPSGSFEDTSTQVRKNSKYDNTFSVSREESSRSKRMHSYYHRKKQPLCKESKNKQRGEKETSRHSSSYWHSYSYYSHDNSRKSYTETSSSYTSYYRSVNDQFGSRSHSRRSRDLLDRSRSRSNSRISHSNRWNRSRSRSNSRICQSNQRNRSRSRSNCRKSQSNWRTQSCSRSNSRKGYSNRHTQSRSRSNSRNGYSNRRNRSHSRSNSRIRQSNRRNRSHSRSSSRISQSNRLNRSHSRSNSKIKSSSYKSRDEKYQRRISRYLYSNKDARRRSRSSSRISSSSRHDRRHSRSSSRMNSSSLRQTSWHYEYGKKRMYKTKHHEEPSRQSFSKSVSNSDEEGGKKKKKKHLKKKKTRSPSIDDRPEGHSRRHHKRKKKNKRKSKRHKSEERMGKHSPVLITITTDSDSESADPSEPSTSSVCAIRSTALIANMATETFLDNDHQSTAGTENSSVGDAGNHP
ncbi:topoisomerase I binding, arginine/serine-rich a [Danio aesculapii]|uniref:topoisomerase I binding, arginine/serine-rich a n=1 Tax=Danio aesculapii TaxID=1142201 RepID=UPI0024BF276A|nr:topoisomerase I binding, arginine/serine-rich a [Danio aesculapii]